MSIWTVLRGVPTRMPVERLALYASGKKTHRRRSKHRKEAVDSWEACKGEKHYCFWKKSEKCNSGGCYELGKARAGREKL